jgi:hypothetical protein
VSHRRGPVAACGVALCALSIACGPNGRDVYDAHNSRDTGPWVSLGRAYGADGSLLVHVAAARPERAEDIARHIVGQNVAASVVPIRVVVDPSSGSGDRRVFRWDGKTLSLDSDATGLPAPATSAPAAHGEQGHG